MEKTQSGNSGSGHNWYEDNDNFFSTINDDVIALSKEKKKEITMKILESSKRSVRLLRNSEEIAVSTSRELHCQSEQLMKAEKNLDALSSSMKKNDQAINKIKSPFGFLWNFMTSTQESLLGWKKQKHTDSKYPKTSKSSLHGGGDFSKLDIAVSNSQGKVCETSSITKGLEKFIDDDLSEISCSIARLKNLALEMGNEVDIQNEHLDHIINKSEKVSVHLQEQNKTIKKLIA